MSRIITTLIAAAFAAITLTLTSVAVASPAPTDNGPVTTSADPSGGRTDQQFWGEAAYENPLSGLNLDRTPAR
jgi:hypothetical protein